MNNHERLCDFAKNDKLSSNHWKIWTKEDEIDSIAHFRAQLLALHFAINTLSGSVEHCKTIFIWKTHGKLKQNQRPWIYSWQLNNFNIRFSLFSPSTLVLKLNNGQKCWKYYICNRWQFVCILAHWNYTYIRTKWNRFIEKWCLEFKIW